MPGYVRIPNEALNTLIDLGSQTMLVYVALMSHRNSKGPCYPAVQTIADETHLTRRSVQRHIRKLEDADLIITVRQTGRGDRPNQYEFKYLGATAGTPPLRQQVRPGAYTVSPPGATAGTPKQLRSEQEKAVAYCNKQGHGWTDLGDTLRCRRCGQEQPNNVIELQA